MTYSPGHLHRNILSWSPLAPATHTYFTLTRAVAWVWVLCHQCAVHGLHWGYMQIQPLGIILGINDFIMMLTCSVTRAHQSPDDLITDLAILVSRWPPVIGNLFTGHQNLVSVHTMLWTAIVIRLELSPGNINFHRPLYYVLGKPHYKKNCKNSNNVTRGPPPPASPSDRLGVRN